MMSFAASCCHETNGSVFSRNGGAVDRPLVMLAKLVPWRQLVCRC